MVRNASEDERGTFPDLGQFAVDSDPVHVTMKLVLCILLTIVLAVSAQSCRGRARGPNAVAEPAPCACRGYDDPSVCCFASIQEAINAPYELCNSSEIILDPGEFTQDCSSYQITSEVHLRARDPNNRPVIKSVFDVNVKDRWIKNMTFSNIVWKSARAVRARRTLISNMEFIGCDFLQTTPDEVMLRFELVTLLGRLRFKSCKWTAVSDTMTSGTSWASFNFINHSRSAILARDNEDLQDGILNTPSGWRGEFILDGVDISSPHDPSAGNIFQLMEIDVDGARNMHIMNSQFRGGATLYLSDSLETHITNTIFKDTGITSTTSSNITISGCTFSHIRVLDPSRSPFARSIYFKDSSQPGFGQRIVRIINNDFHSFVPAEPIQISAIAFSASPARIYFDSVLLQHNRFDGFHNPGLFAISNEDFEPQIAAKMNWWGSRSGPNDGCNRQGKGAKIFWDRENLRMNVDYRPWCANAQCSQQHTSARNCPWPAWVYAVVILSGILGLVCFIVGLLLIRQYITDRRYSRLANERDEEYHSRLLQRVKNLDELLAKYNVTRIFMHQLEVGERIGEGTFGYVHKASYTPTQEIFGFVDLSSQGKKRNVAVKYIKNRWLLQYDSLGNFLDEIKIMSMVHHPHVQSLIGLAVDKDENICMVSEFMARGSLNTVIDRKELNLPRKLDISLDTAYGMAHLHSKGMSVVHRDLKPGNILVSKEWVARVADFGTSIAVRQESLVASAVGTTPVYLSPEAALRNEFSQASDVFAYGITIYELWAEEISYPTLTDGGLSIIQEYAEERREPDLPRLPELPHAISSLIRACISYEPEDRPTFDDILSDLVSHREEIRAHVRGAPAKPPKASTSSGYSVIGGSTLEMDNLAATPSNTMTLSSSGDFSF